MLDAGHVGVGVERWRRESELVVRGATPQKEVLVDSPSFIERQRALHEIPIDRLELPVVANPATP